MDDGYQQGEVDDVGPKRRGRRLPITFNRGEGPQPGEGTFLSLRALAAFACVALVVGGVWLFFQRSGLSGGDTLGPAPVEQQELTLTDAQSIYGALAPWQDSTIIDGVELPQAQDTILWLGNDGSIMESTFSAQTDDWRVSRPPFITNLSVTNELVVLTINQGFDYHMYGNQPFLYESQPETAFRYNPETGDVEAISTETLLQAPADN